MDKKEKSDAQKSIKTKTRCYFCNRDFEIKLNDFSNCLHKICAFCIFERIFSHHIADLQGQKILKVSCKCENSFCELELEKILTILGNKRKVDLNKVIDSGFENIEATNEGCECSKKVDDTKQLFSDYFCLDCLKWVCSKCRFDLKNAHYKHRVIKSRHLIKYLKDNIKNIFLQNINFEQFEKKWEEMSNQFQKIIDESFNETLKKLDDLIQSAENLKKIYLKEYEEQIANHIKTFKIIKLYYMNYYTDKSSELKKLNVENNDIFKLKYLSNISHEFTDFSLSYPDTLDKEIEKINEQINNLKPTEMELIKGKFTFQKIAKEYYLDEVQPAHSKFITSLILLDNKIISGSKDYFIKIWDNESGNYKLKQTIRAKQIASLLALKNGKILASAYNSNDILVYELDEKEEYFSSQSLSHHDKCVTTIVELEDGKIISGSLDGKIIIWEENQKLKQYMIRQEIDKGKPILLIIKINGFNIAYTGGENIGILGTNTDLNDGRLILRDYYEICELEKHKGKVNCMCNLNNGYFASGGADLNKRIDHNIYIWKEFGGQYTSSQKILNAHDADINSLILLRDGRIASASKDRSIRIWRIKKPIEDTQITYILEQELNHYQHGLYKLIQLIDDRFAVTSTDNNIVIFKNNEGII